MLSTTSRLTTSCLRSTFIAKYVLSLRWRTRKTLPYDPRPTTDSSVKSSRLVLRRCGTTHFPTAEGLSSAAGFAEAAPPLPWRAPAPTPAPPRFLWPFSSGTSAAAAAFVLVSPSADRDTAPSAAPAGADDAPVGRASFACCRRSAWSFSWGSDGCFFSPSSSAAAAAALDSSAARCAFVLCVMVSTRRLWLGRLSLFFLESLGVVSGATPPLFLSSNKATGSPNDGLTKMSTLVSRSTLTISTFLTSFSLPAAGSLPSSVAPSLCAESVESNPDSTSLFLTISTTSKPLSFSKMCTCCRNSLDRAPERMAFSMVSASCCGASGTSMHSSSMICTSFSKPWNISLGLTALRSLRYLTSFCTISLSRADRSIAMEIALLISWWPKCGALSSR
mmetsp:Transcript_3279/g.6144  ORF Transcript_3279/g.6144 Transcript_3279/m.6144 type:complete len:391 (+) Transcript_3279:1051-2223(+)